MAQFERFDQKSEDQNAEMEQLRSNKTLEQSLNGISSMPEEITMESLNEQYAEKMVTLRTQILRVKSYITAKENAPPLIAELERLVEERPTYDTFIAKAGMLQSYKNAIERFEVANSLSPEDYTEVKSAYDDAQAVLKTIEDIQKVATTEFSAN